MRKGSLFYPILNYKCPRCHEGDLYPTSTFSFSKTFTMNDACDKCGQEYELEPGFYWGAMYVAYALTSGLMLSGFAIIYFFFDTDIWTAFGIMAGIAVLLYGLIFRTSRAIWITMFVRYRGDKAIENYQKSNLSE